MGGGISHRNDSPKLDSAASFKTNEMEDLSNGFYLSNHYIPEEVLTVILSNASPKDLIKYSLVCKNWNRIIKSNRLWLEIFKHKFKSRKLKSLPWYVYYALFATEIFDVNLLKNGNGQDNYKHWMINKNFGDGFIIENPPQGCNPLPLDVAEFKGHTSCFATSYYECSKSQIINLDNSKLAVRILNEFKPHILVSEWVCGRWDCGCVYTLKVKIISQGSKAVKEYILENRIEQWSNPTWKKMDMVISDYPDNIKEIIFEHEGKDLLFWKGHYGSKMAGAQIKICFESIN